MRRLVILLAALAVAAGAAGTAQAKPVGDSNVGPGFGSCINGMCCPSAATPPGTETWAYGIHWLCSVGVGWIDIANPGGSPTFGVKKPYSNVPQCPCGGPYGLPDCTYPLNHYVAYVNNGTGVIVEEECFFFGGGWQVTGYAG